MTRRATDRHVERTTDGLTAFESDVAGQTDGQSAFEPRVIVFLCNWCSYEGADAAGRARVPSPASFTPIRVMCSGRIDPQFVLEAFAEGADGVLILGCHPGDCHYRDGNHNAMRRSVFLKRVLAQFGIEEGRLRLDWVSASESERFGRVLTEMVDTLRELGPRGRPCLKDGVPAEAVAEVDDWTTPRTRSEDTTEYGSQHGRGDA
ncbi:MAG: hydrogenase iron-sulfur subunit [Candidatus Eisenbacteria bacterium]